MKRNIAQLWHRTLLSPEIVQGRGYLDSNGKVCPLGLLCQLAMLEGVCDTVQVNKSYAYDKELGRLPASVQEWAGMYGRNGEIRGELLNLTFYNDVLDYTLAELADVIKENYERL